MHTNLNDEFVRFSGSMVDHSHLPNPAELEIGDLREAMWQRAENKLLSLQEIAEQETWSIKPTPDLMRSYKIRPADKITVGSEG